MITSFYVNLPTKDVSAASDFYTSMGFEIDAEYSNDQNVFVIIREHIKLILADEDFFRQSEQRDVADTSTVAEVGLAIEVADREKVDRMFDAGIAAGGKQAGETVEEAEIGMYSRGLTDPDGHRLDILCMAT